MFEENIRNKYIRNEKSGKNRLVFDWLSLKDKVKEQILRTRLSEIEIQQYLYVKVFEIKDSQKSKSAACKLLSKVRY